MVEAQGPRPEHLTEKVDFDEYTVRRTLLDLWDDGLITGIRADLNDMVGFYAIAIRLTPDGLRAVNEWPSGERSFDALVEVLTEMAEAEPDPEKRSRPPAARRRGEGAPARPRGKHRRRLPREGQRTRLAGIQGPAGGNGSVQPVAITFASPTCRTYALKTLDVVGRLA